MTTTRMVTKLRDKEELIIDERVRISWHITEYSKRLVIQAPIEVSITKKTVQDHDDGETQQQETEFRQRRDGKRIARS